MGCFQLERNFSLPFRDPIAFQILIFLLERSSQLSTSLPLSVSVSLFLTHQERIQVDVLDRMMWPVKYARRQPPSKRLA